VASEVIENKSFYELQNGFWNITRLRELLEDILANNSVFNDFEVAYVAAAGDPRTLLINARTVISKDPDAHLILLAIEEVTRRRQAEAALETAHAEVQRWTQELAATNKELESFSYSVSHDLRAPLNRIVGFSDILLEGYADKLDDEGKKNLNRVINGAARMNRIIDGLLHLAQISRHGVQRQDVDMSKIAASVTAGLLEAQPDRRVALEIQEGVTAFADEKLIEVALMNLLSNAWKFTSKTENARIEFGSFEQDGKTVYSVRDNGAGFDHNFFEKLFLPFQRLHSEQDYEGTGIGLAIVERVIRRHGGEIWAESKTGEGAAFFFTLN
jgi:light-regulated signal transduction histidine kinase (bacteriophytochrome)